MAILEPVYGTGAFTGPMTVIEETDPPDQRLRIDELAAARAALLEGPSSRASQAQRAKGKLTVRERLDLLFDPGSFREVEGFRRHRASGFGLEQL